VQQIQADGNINGTVITGTTGFVGGELLIKLLRHSARRLICPVRAGSDQAAVERGHNRLVELVGKVDALELQSRVQWLRGDIEECQLGWNRQQWHDVAMQTNEIYHCAASVSFDLPLDQAHRINVEGTIHVYELAQAAAARHGNFERFHHVSTAYVAGTTNGRVDSDFVPADTAGNFRNTYERTKARAERYLRAEASSNVPVSIHRPSIIAGNSLTGRTTNWNVLYVPMKMVARGALPVFPRGGREIVDAVAVDFLVDGMVTFGQLDNGRLASHHLTAGPTAFTVTDLITLTSEMAAAHGKFAPSNTTLLRRPTWLALVAAVKAMTRLPKRVGAVRVKARMAKRGIDQCSVYLPYTQVNTTFDAAKDHDVLRVFGVNMPDGPTYLETITAYALATNFGKISGDRAVAATS